MQDTETLALVQFVLKLYNRSCKDQPSMTPQNISAAGSKVHLGYVG